MARSIDNIVVGVRSIDKATDMWINHFGLDVVSERNGADSDLSKLWGLDDDQIEKQVLLTKPQVEVGRIHWSNSRIHCFRFDNMRTQQILVQKIWI